MNFRFQRKRLSGILSILPPTERSFLEEMRNYNFPESRSLKLKEVMGYDKRRVASPDICLSDLAVFGLRRLFERGLLRPEEIDALLVVSTSLDHIIPPTSNLIQGRLGLKQDMLCLDISQACAGFVIGLLQAFLLLEQESVRKVVLVNGDLLSRKASPQDRNIYPLIGDAAAITVVERDPGESVIHASVQMDGQRAEALVIPAGGFRLPCTPETAVLEDVGDNNRRAKDHLRMDGTAIFNFVQTEVPPMIERLLQWAGLSHDAVDYYLCHQPNRFMLQKLADKMKVPHERMPNNVVEHFGNSGGATIPIAITHNLAPRLREGSIQACLAGFGGGLVWAGMLMKVGPLAFCDTIVFS